LLNHVLKNREGLKVAVIVNDMSDVNIDATFVKGHAELSRFDDKLIDLHNGCICCTLREDLLVEIIKLAKEQRFDYLLIESTGISEPMPVAETFTFGPKGENAEMAGIHVLSEVAHLDTMVTVVDCLNFWDRLGSLQKLVDVGESASPEDERNVANLLIDQVEFANVILLNKTDLVSAEAVAKIKSLIEHLNPSALIQITQRSVIDIKTIINTNRFDFLKAVDAPGWLKELRGEHVPETIEYGISSFIYNARKPFHPGRLWDLFENKALMEPVLRGKGFIWLASRDEYMGEWEKAGKMIETRGSSEWYCELPEDQWDLPKEIAMTQFVDGVGDKRQEMVFIGVGMDKEQILHLLELALLTPDEMALGPGRWEDFEDKFEEWDCQFEVVPHDHDGDEHPSHDD